MMNINRLIRQVKSYNPSADIEAIKKAYQFAYEAHKGQMRLSNEPYITHPLWVAYILAELRLDTPTIIAGLLHDSVEDTSLTPQDLREKFKDEVAQLVEGVSRMGEVARTSEEEKTENIRKMLIAMARDIRVVFIKLADRLHNMRTLEFLDHTSQLVIAHETLEIYAPLAHRLGIGRIKWELEDLAFMYLEPEAHRELERGVAKARPELEAYIEKVISLLKEELKKIKIETDISGRPKHFYSIHKKMVEHQKSLKDIYDLLAIRVNVDDIKDCYGVLGVAHALFKPIPGRFKDYIGMPKSNMYQALHTTVIGPEGRPVEIQIKTHKMHQTAEEGVAAHWHYKEGGAWDERFAEKLGFLRRFLEWQKESIDTQEFMEELKIDVFADEVFVFTPKGEIKELPKGSTPIDFAYAIHTDIGFHTAAAKVNGKIVPLRYQLNSGDRVEIITSPRTTPSRDWLKFVKTSKAKGRIRRWFYDQIKKEGSSFKETTLPEPHREKKEHPSPKVSYRSIGVVITGVDGLSVHLAKCCSPVPNDKIIGYITQGRGVVSIHHQKCPNLFKLLDDPDRITEVSWDNREGKPIYYKVSLTLLARDRPNLLADILLAISSTSTVINAAEARAIEGGFTRCGFEVAIQDKDALGKVIDKIEKVDGVIEIHRSQSR
ncbi:TPA: (p)ppGpp synthetase [bacterium]|nr:(p)ppGpp synthetase [bacterium]